MEAVKRGADRQETHERLRQHARAAADTMKATGASPDLLERLRSDPDFRDLPWDDILDPRRYIGRAPEQVEEFVRDWVEPALAPYSNTAQTTGEELVQI